MTVLGGGTVQADPVPGEVTNLRLSSGAPGELTITWDAPSDAPADYRVAWARDDLSYLSWDASNETHRGSSYPGGADTSLTLTGLTGGETYKVRMRSRYNPGTSEGRSGPWTDEATQRVQNNPPVAPTDLSATETKGKDETSIDLSWTAPSHDALTGYRIWRGADADSLSELVQDTGNTDASYSDATTEADNTYVYAVTALSLDGDSPRSATVSITRAAAGITAQDDPENTARSSHDRVTGLTAVGGENRITISWDRLGTSQGYFLQWSKLDVNGNPQYPAHALIENTPTSGQFRVLQTNTISHTTPTNLEAGIWKVRIRAQTGTQGGRPIYGPYNTESTEITVTAPPTILASSYTGNLGAGGGSIDFTKIATQFTTGDNEHGHELTQVTHPLYLDAAGTGIVGAALHADNAGIPGAEVYAFPDQTFTNTNPQAVTHVGEVLLERNKKYWIVLTRKSGSTVDVYINRKSSSAEVTAQPGWSLATPSSHYTSGAWTDEPGTNAIRLEGFVQPRPIVILTSNYTGAYNPGTESRQLAATASGTLFTTGDNQTGYLLTKVTHGMRLEDAGSETARAWVAPDSNGEPDVAVYQFPDRTITDTVVQAVTHVGGVLLEPNKKYWILLERVSPPATHIHIHYKRSDDVVTGLPGWILATTSSYNTLNGYVALNAAYAIRLEGTVLTPTTDEPSDSDFSMEASTRGRLRIGETSTGILDAVDDKKSGDLLKIEGLEPGHSYRIRAWFGRSKEDSATAARGGAIGLQFSRAGIELASLVTP